MRSIIGSGLAVLGLLGATLYVFASTPSAPPTDGRTLFQTRGCIGCHNVSDKGLRSNLGFAPDLAALRLRAPRLRPELAPEAYVRESVRQPQAFRSAGATEMEMPVLPVTDAELEAIVAFLLS